MQLELQNINDSMTLSSNFRMRISSYKKRVGISKRYGKDGGVVTGDRMVDSRDITLEFDPTAMNDTDYLALMNEIVGFFRNDLSPYYLVDTENSRRTEVAFKELPEDPAKDGLEWRIGKSSIKLEMLDSHWEDLDETTISETAVASNDIISVTNNSNIEAYPLIKVRPTQFNSDLWIKNNTTGAGFVLGSSAFGPGSEFQIDSKNGTIYLIAGLSSVESSAALADGSGFISLVPGINLIQYQSIFGNVDIDILFRKRYAI